MSYTIENLHFDDKLNFGINTDISLSNTSSKILTIVDVSGRGIILPNSGDFEKEPNYYNIPFQNKYLGSFSYNTNNYFDIYGKNGWCPFDINYLNNTGRYDDGMYVSEPQVVTRIDFNDNKMSFRTDPSGITPVERLVIDSSGSVGIGKSDLISNYEPSYELDVNGAIDCQELYLNGTLLNPAETHNLTSVIITNSNIANNINISKIETNDLSINTCLTIMQTLDISSNVNVNGTLIGNAIYKYTDVSNETYKDSSDKMYIHDVDISSVGLPKMTDETAVDLNSIYYNTSDNSIKNSTNTILNAADNSITVPPNLFSGTSPSYFSFNTIPSITYHSNWWGFTLGLTGGNIKCLDHIQNSPGEDGMNSGGTVTCKISQNGSDTFGFESDSATRTGFYIKKSGYYYGTVVFPLNGSTAMSKTFTFGFLKDTYSVTALQNIDKTYSEFYILANVSPLDDNDNLFKSGNAKDTNYQVEGFSSNSSSVTPLPTPTTGRVVTHAGSLSSVNYSYEYSFPFLIATDEDHFVSFFASASGSNYYVHNGLRIQFFRYGDFDESDFITSTFGTNTEESQVSTNQTGAVIPGSVSITWENSYDTNGVPNGSNSLLVATLYANNATGYSITNQEGYDANGDSVVISDPFIISSNQLYTSSLFTYSRYNVSGISFDIVGSNSNGSGTTLSSNVSFYFPVPSETIIIWDGYFGSGSIPVDTSPTITIGTLTSDTEDATGFTLIATTRGNELLEIVGSNLNLIGVIEQSDVGTLDFSINAINDTGTQVTATDFTIEFYGSLMNTYSVTGTYEENEYTGSDNYGIDVSYVTVKFTDDGTITFDQDTTVDYLVVGGGGRSGWGSSGYMSSGDPFAGNGGGGGGGGVVIKTDQTLSLNTQYEVIVGSDEEDSSFNSTFAGGGGRGGIGTYQAVTGSAGSVGSEGAGSHGGGGGGGIYGYYRSADNTYITVEGGAGATSPGYSGGDYFHTSGVWYFSGGGGGAGGSAEDSGRFANEHDTAEGGPGVMSDITGTQIYYGAGGRGQLAGNSGGNWVLNGLLTRSNNFTDGAYGNGGDASNNSTVTAGIIDYGNDGVVIIRFLKYPES